MIVKNQSKFKSRELNPLIDWVTENFQPLVDGGVEIHIRQFNGKGDMFGISFAGFDLRIEKYCKEIRHGHLIHDTEETTKQLAIVYITKHPEKYEAFKDMTWQEAFVTTLVHELRHLWYDRKLKGRDEEDDAEHYEKRALTKYRKYKRESGKTTHTG